MYIRNIYYFRLPNKRRGGFVPTIFFVIKALGESVNIITSGPPRCHPLTHFHHKLNCFLRPYPLFLPCSTPFYARSPKNRFISRRFHATSATFVALGGGGGSGRSPKSATLPKKVAPMQRRGRNILANVALGGLGGSAANQKVRQRSHLLHGNGDLLFVTHHDKFFVHNFANIITTNIIPLILLLLIGVFLPLFFYHIIYY